MRTHRSRTIRTIALSASAATLTFGLTACNGDDLVGGGGTTTAPTVTVSPPGSSGGTGGTSSSGGSGGSTGSGGSGTSGSSGNSKGSGGSGGSEDSGGSGIIGGSKDSDGSDGSGGVVALPACSTSNAKVTMTPVDRPVNFEVLTLTNTGSEKCVVEGIPNVFFGPDIDGLADSSPVVGARTLTLDPGQEAYAGVNTSPASAEAGSGHAYATTASVALGEVGDQATPFEIRIGRVYIYEPTVSGWRTDIGDALM